MRRHKLSDAEWALLEPLLPAQRTGGDHFAAIESCSTACYFALAPAPSGATYPSGMGPGNSCTRATGRWMDAAGQIDWTLWCIDGSSVRAHKAAAGAARGDKPAAA